jgi:pyridoxal phosphate enzyme (YggS family)
MSIETLSASNSIRYSTIENRANLRKFPAQTGNLHVRSDVGDDKLCSPYSLNKPAMSLESVLRQIKQAEEEFGREPGSTQLLAVSKRRTPIDILEVIKQGQIQFGESYVQEASQKISTLANYALIWHFIGPIQSNKTSTIANEYDWVHSIDRLKIAGRLSSQRHEKKSPLNVCIQVNISGEETKSGVAPEKVEPLAEQIRELPNLHLRGLMTLPAPARDFEQQRAPFRQMRELLESLNQKGFELDTLSMGTSNDMRAAIAEGSTIVRIGTALFGPRP